MPAAEWGRAMERLANGRENRPRATGFCWLRHKANTVPKTLLADIIRSELLTPCMRKPQEWKGLGFLRACSS